MLLHNALPFVGFGFLDNCIMIVAVSLSARCSVAEPELQPGNQTLAVCCDALISCTVGTFGTSLSEEATNKSLLVSAKLFSACFRTELKIDLSFK